MADPVAHRPLSRRVLIVFALVTAMMGAQLCWWVTFNLRQAKAQRLAREERAQSEATLATALLRRGAQGNEAPFTWLQGTFPNLVLEVRRDTPGGLRAVLSEETRHRLSARGNAHVRMFAAEGGFFLGMFLLGATLIWRTMRREVLVIRQEANFLSAVTHELKSPLASLRLHIETQLARSLPLAMQQRYLTRMESDVSRLEQLVANLLASARLETDAAPTPATPMRGHFGAATERALKDATTRLEANKLRLSVAIDSAPLWVALDEATLVIIVSNLIDNALKYGAGGERIEVALREEAGKVRLSIRDYGVGLESREQTRVFDKFYRVGDEMVRRHPGSGLGLYVVRSLVETARGEISIKSAGLGQGAEVVVKLPAARLPAREAA